MQIEIIGHSNIQGMNRDKKVDVEPGNFLEILNPLVSQEDSTSSPEELDTELIDLVAGEVEEEEDVKDNDQTLAMMLNFPWVGTREIKNLIPQDDLLGGALEIEELPKGNILTMGNILVDEDNVVEENIDNKDLEMDDIKDSTPIESFKEVENVLMKEDGHSNDKVGFKEELFISQEGVIHEDAIEEHGETLLGLDNEFEDIKEELSIEEKDTSLQATQWTSVSQREIQRNILEPTTDINFSEEVLSTENIERVSESIIKLMETRTEGDTQVMKVKLYPEELGNVDITLKMEEGKLIAKILVDNEGVRQLFMNNIQDLNENLLKQNIHIGDMNVDLSNDSHGHSQREDRKPFKTNKNLRINSGMANSENTQTIIDSEGLSILA